MQFLIMFQISHFVLSAVQKSKHIQSPIMSYDKEKKEIQLTT